MTSLSTWTGTAWEIISSNAANANILETPKILTSNQTITQNTNALIMGPIAISSGVEITVSTNSQLTVHY